MGITVIEKGNVNIGHIFYIALHLLIKHESKVEKKGGKTEVYLPCQWQPVKKLKKLCNTKKTPSSTFQETVYHLNLPCSYKLPLASSDATVIIRKQAVT